MIYKIKQTDIFNDQLNSIIFYIADDSGDVDVALNILNRIEEDIMKLQEFPERGIQPHYTILRRQGYRILITMRWLVFYKTDHTNNTVMLYAITDQKQEYISII